MTNFRNKPWMKNIKKSHKQSDEKVGVYAAAVYNPDPLMAGTECGIKSRYNSSSGHFNTLRVLALVSLS